MGFKVSSYICTEVDFSSIPRSIWDDLVAKSQTATYFQSHNWLFSWLKNFNIKSCNILILMVHQNSELVAIAPFFITENTISFLGVSAVNGETLCDYGDIIAKVGLEFQAWDSILSYLEKRHAIKKYKFLLDCVSENSPTVQYFNSRNESIDLKPIYVSPHIIFPDNIDTHFSLLKKHNRSELKRKLRKAANSFVGLEMLPAGNEAADKYWSMLPYASQVKKDFYCGNTRLFFDDLIRSEPSEQHVFIHFAHIDNKPVSGIIIFNYKQNQFAYNSISNTDYLSSCASIAVFHNAIQRGILRKDRVFSFLRGNDDYKYRLGAVDEVLFQIEFHLRGPL